MAGSTKQTSTSSNKIDPAQFDLYMQNFRNAQGNAGILSPVTGQPVTPGTPGANAPLGSAPLDAATAATTGMLNFDPGSLAGTDLTPYMNPFQKSVTDATISDQDRARQMAQVGDNQRATAAGAFGGSRSGVLGAETNSAYDRNTGQLLAGLNSQNFTQAQGAAQNDIQTKMAAAGLRLNAAGQLVDESGQVIAHAGQIQGILNSGLGIMPVQSTTNSTGKTTTDPGLAGILSSLGSVASAFAGPH